MKTTVTASQARRELFKLMDRVAESEDGDVEEIIAEIRAEQNRPFEAKMERIFADA